MENQFIRHYADKCVSTMVNLDEIKYELLRYPPQLPDWAPKGNYLFRNLKLKKFVYESVFHRMKILDQNFSDFTENPYRNGKNSCRITDKRIEVEEDNIY